MSFRSRLPEHVPPGAWLLIAATLAWWGPTIALRCTGILAMRARFGAEMLAADVLVALGRRRAARRILVKSMLRSRRLMRAKRASMEGPRR